MDKMKKLHMKKGMGKMHPLEQKAKMGVVHDMQKMAHAAMSGKLKGMNKVSVASDSKQGLEHGLDKAHDLLNDANPDHEGFQDAHDMDSNHDDGMHDPEMMAEGGEVESMGDSQEMTAEDSPEHFPTEDGVPDYHSMDEDELSNHMEKLKEALDRRGM